jgi:hypothetical protein
MAERSTAGTVDLAFRHANSPTFEGEAARVALACAVWGPLSVGESPVAGSSARPPKADCTLNYQRRGDLRASKKRPRQAQGQWAVVGLAMELVAAKGSAPEAITPEFRVLRDDG